MNQQKIKEALADAYTRLTSLRSGGAAEYWEARYKKGGLSGDGSVGRLAEFKAEILNGLVEEFDVTRVLEVGSGDGQQLTLANYPEYLGIDISPTAVHVSSERHAAAQNVSFLCMNTSAIVDKLGVLQADMAISLDVVYHILEKSDFDAHLDLLFGSATKLVVIYSSNSDSLPATLTERAHIKHWPVPRIAQSRFGSEWELSRHVPARYPFDPADGMNSSISDFYIFTKTAPK